MFSVNRSKKKIICSGSILAFLIGSGFASGQETLQFFTVYGLRDSLLGLCVCFVIMAYVTVTVLQDSHTLNLEDCNDIFKFYCGKYLGLFFKWEIPLFLYLAYVTMLSGSGSLGAEYLDLPRSVGILFMGIISMITVLLGLEKLVDVIGRIGPILIAVVSITSVICIIQNWNSLLSAESYIVELELIKATPNWFLSSINYASFASVGIYPFLAGIGPRMDKKGVCLCGLISIIGFMATMTLLTGALLSRISDVYKVDVPTVYIANEIFHGLGSLFAVIMVLGIYTSAVPFLWNAVKKICIDEKCWKYRIGTIVLVFIACLGGRLPFAILINIIFPIQGYIGMLMLLAVVIKSIRRRLGRKNHLV